MSANQFLITGSDEAGIDLEARRIFRREAGDTPDPMSVDVIRERDDAPAAEAVHQAIAALLSPSFFGGRKVVWLQGYSGFVAAGGRKVKGGGEGAVGRLQEILSGGLPPDMVFILSGPGGGPDHPLAAAIRGRGEIVVCNRPNLKDRNWREAMGALTEKRAAEKQMRLSPEAVDYLVEVIATDTLRLEGELDKLACFAAEPAADVTLAEVQEICRGEGEALFWTFSDAVGDRRLEEALHLIQVLLVHEKDENNAARALLSSLAGLFRTMLQIRVFMQEHKGLKTADQIVNAVRQLQDNKHDAERAAAIQAGFEFLTMNPYRLKLLAQRALHYSGNELVQAFPLLQEALYKCVSGSSSSRVVLEDLVLRMIRRSAAA